MLRGQFAGATRGKQNGELPMTTTNYNKDATCQVCRSACKGILHEDPVNWEGDCPTCGNYWLEAEANAVLLGHNVSPEEREIKEARLSHAIKKEFLSTGERVRVTREFVEVAINTPIH